MTPHVRNSIGHMGLRAVAALCLLSSLSACVLPPPPPPPPVVLLPLPR